MRDEAAGVRKGRGREFGREDAREGEARRETPPFPPSSRALRASLAPKTPFPFPFKRKPRRLPSERLREGRRETRL